MTDEIIAEFRKFCGEGSFMIQYLDQGFVIMCQHGRHPISYKFTDVSLSTACQRHEMVEVSKPTRVRYY